MTHEASQREFSERELAAFRVFAAKHLQRTRADFVRAQHERKLTLAMAKHLRLSAIAAKLFEQLGDAGLSAEARRKLWAELGEPDPASPDVGQAALHAAASLDTSRRRKPPRQKPDSPSPTATGRQNAVRLHLVDKVPVSELAAKFSVTPETVRLWVRNHLKQHGAYDPRRRSGAPASTKAEAARLAISGSHSVVQLAEKYGYHPTTVARWVREHRAAAGMPKPSRQKVPDEVRLRTLRLIFEEGLAPTIAARHCGVSSNSAHVWASRYRAEHGTPIPKYDRSVRHPYPPETKTEAIRLIFDRGKRVSQAASELAVPVATARVWAEDHQRETGAEMPGLAPISKETREQAARAHHELGVPIETIARQLHVLPRTVKTWVYSYAPSKAAPTAARRPRKNS
ncbi:MAG: hypothetical protein ACRC20_04070 [Segniliparus sp.]|uniref:hypothetical protein n=1 Tax=Segniliparus sp. TaxID=2804064 RepID=UPI003F3E83E3